MTSKATWKNFEKEMAKRLKIKRVSKGKLGEKVEDIRGSLKLKGDKIIISGECKLRAKIPAIINEALKQANENSPTKNHIPVAFIKTKYGSYDDVVVAMKLTDFERLLEEK